MLRLAAAMTVLLAAPRALPARTKARFPAVLVHHVNTNQEVRFALYDAKGHPQRAELRRMEKLLRCHHTGKGHRMHWRLMQLLYRVARHYPAQRLDVVAGYRDPRIAKDKGVPKSNHTRGRAVDFRVPGVKNEDLRDFLRTFPKVGVGYYPNSTFVHLDVRDDRGAYWVDASGPGETAHYEREEEPPHASR